MSKNNNLLEDAILHGESIFEKEEMDEQLREENEKNLLEDDVEDVVPQSIEPPDVTLPTDGVAEEPETRDLVEEKAESHTFSEKPYYERYYLKYREGKRSIPLDLQGTRVFLQSLGFDGGELRQAREKKNCFDNSCKPDERNNNQMYCSYCGMEISGVEFYRLPDGRLRCTACSGTVVKIKEEMEAICKRIIANMDVFFGATIDVPVSISIVEERKLKKKLGVPLGTKDQQSMLILGVAINKKKKYGIILENGAPRISLIATFAHELTHIWQYTHWDNNPGFKKCPKSKRLLLYEGMAKWVEIQYLYLVGETNVARREEHITRNRQDEYGIGFCLYEDRYPLSRETMTCENTPFTADKYPFD